jgi:subtilisin family serine protease
MATPVVSGLAALMMSAKPDITPRELMDLFTSTAVDLGDPGKVSEA